MSQRTTQIHVLHVDDEPGFGEMVAEFLELEDDRFEVTTATSASDGLNYLTQADIEVDCIVSDYDMPGHTGIEFLEIIRDEYPALPFILYTGHGSEQVASKAISAGVTDYLQKEAGTEQYAVLANRIRNAVDKRQAERDRQRQLEAIETAQEGISILDQDSHFLYVNQAYAELYGYEPQELVGEHWEVVYPDEEVGTVREEILPVVEERGQWHGTTTGLRADGSTFREDHRLATTDRGELVCSIRDVSEQRAQQRELAAERALIDQALNVVDDVFYVIGPDGTMRRWSAELSRVTGYSDQEIAEMEVTEFFPESEQDRIMTAVEEALTTGDVVIEAEFQTADQERVLYEFTGSRVTDPTGDIIGLVGIGRDIADRKAYEQKLTALHDTAGELTTSTTVNEVCEQAIAASEQILEFDLSVIDIEADGILEKTAASGEVVADQMTDMPIDEGIAGTTYRTGESFLIDDLTTHDSANPQGPFRSAISVPLGDHGVFQAVAETTGAFNETDLELTELLVSHATSALDRIEHEQTLEQQNERLERFTSAISHDLQSPLNVAQGRINLAREMSDSENLEQAAAAIERSLTLTEDLLTLARDGDDVTETESLQLADVVRASWTAVASTKATISVETTQEIQADRSRLKQLLENLLGNAIDHGGSDVSVTVGTLDSKTGFYIADDGPGIPEDKRERVSETGYSSKENGTGFGLNIVQETADAHGWDLTVTESDAGGARFEICGVAVDKLL